VPIGARHQFSPQSAPLNLWRGGDLPEPPGRGFSSLDDCNIPKIARHRRVAAVPETRSQLQVVSTNGCLSRLFPPGTRNPNEPNLVWLFVTRLWSIHSSCVRSSRWPQDMPRREADAIIGPGSRTCHLGTWSDSGAWNRLVPSEWLPERRADCRILTPPAASRLAPSADPISQTGNAPPVTTQPCHKVAASFEPSIPR
jgi:hypothetical protein